MGISAVSASSLPHFYLVTEKQRWGATAGKVILMVVIESPQGRQERVSEWGTCLCPAPPSWPRALCKPTDQQGFGQGIPDGSASAMLRPLVQIGWSRHTREPLHQFKVGYKTETSISLAGSFLQLSEGEFSLSLASLQQDSKLLLLYSLAQGAGWSLLPDIFSAKP